MDILLSNSTCHFSPLIAYSNELPSDHAPVVTTIDADIETKDTAKIFHYKEADCIRYQIYVNERINANVHFENNDEIDAGIEHLIKIRVRSPARK